MRDITGKGIGFWKITVIDPFVYIQFATQHDCWDFYRSVCVNKVGFWVEFNALIGCNFPTVIGLSESQNIAQVVSGFVVEHGSVAICVSIVWAE